MPIEKPKKWKKQSEKSSSATDFCKLCFKRIPEPSLSVTFRKLQLLCPTCYKKFSPRFDEWREKGVSFLSIYPYSAVKEALYQFKGCGDYELKDVFFFYPLDYLRIRYRGYVVVPVPSSKSHNEERGFNQVVEMARPLGFPILDVLEKTAEVKQSDLNAAERKEVWRVLAIKKQGLLKGKKVLLVDDVFTTGSTVRACLNLLKKEKPRKLAVLTMAKTESSA